MTTSSDEKIDNTLPTAAVALPVRAFTRINSLDLMEETLEREVLIGSGILFGQDSSLIFSAPPKHHKSWFILNLGLHLAAGQDFLGWSIPEPRRVLYFALENGRYVTQSRLDEFRARNPDLAEGFSNFDVAYTAAPIWIEGRGLNEEYGRVIAARPTDVVIIDTLRTAHLADESDSAEMTEIMQAIRSLCDDRQVVPVVVHHTRKSKIDPHAPMDSIRGSSGIAGWYTTLVVMDGTNEERTDFILYIEGRDLDGPDKLAVHYDVKGTRLFTARALENGQTTKAAQRDSAREERIQDACAAVWDVARSGGGAIPRNEAIRLFKQRSLSVRDVEDALARLQVAGAKVEGSGPQQRTLVFAGDPFRR